MKALTKRQERLYHLLLFLVRLLLFSVPLYLIIDFGLNLSGLQQVTVSWTMGILATLGLPVTAENFLVIIGGSTPFRFIISEDCTAWKSMLFFLALVFAVPQGRRRLWALLGLPVIWFGNLARIVGAVLIQQAFGTPAALLAHDIFWKLGMVALVLGLWWLWLRRSSKIVKGKSFYAER